MYKFLSSAGLASILNTPEEFREADRAGSPEPVVDKWVIIVFRAITDPVVKGSL